MSIVSSAGCKLEISREILNRTTQCKKKFACLSDPSVMENVESYFPEDILFVSDEQCERCDYKVPVGYSVVCNCPVRQAIYKQYEK